MQFDDQNALQSLSDFLYNSKMTKDEAQAYLNTLGYEGEIKTTPVETTTHHKYIRTDEDGNKTITEEDDISTVNVAYLEGAEVKDAGIKGTGNITGLTAITNTKDKAKTLKANNTGSSSSSGSSSSTNEGKGEDYDRYYEVNHQLENTESTLKKIQSIQDRLVGKNKVGGITQQLSLMNKQLDLTKQKLKIAQEEAAEYEQKLASTYGATFDSNGMMTNAEEIWNKEKARYEAASSDDDDAAERWENFTEWFDKVQELTTSTIADLEQEIQDQIDEIIDTKIEGLNAELEVYLDLDEAEQQWEEFEKKVIKGLTDEDILENAEYTVKRYGDIYGGKALETAMKNLSTYTSELQKMYKDSSYISNLFSADGVNDMAKALEQVEAMSEDVQDLLEDAQDQIEELNDYLIDALGEMAETQEDLQSIYDTAIKTYQHDMKLIQSIYGESAYGQLSEYYSSVTEMYKTQWDAQQANATYWQQQMSLFEVGTEAWEEAKDNWISAIESEQEALENYINASTEEYINSINAVFEALNTQITDGAGLDYIAEEWGFISNNAEDYLDAINSAYGIQQLQNKYLDAIDGTDNLKAQQKLNDLMEEQISMLQEKDKLTQYDLDRAELMYEIALKQIELEEAQQNKSTMRLRRDSQGNYTYQYTSDEDEISKLQEELSDLYNQLYNLDSDQYRENLNEIYDVWEEYQEKMAEAAEINDPEERHERELLLQEYYGDRINTLVGQNEDLKTNLYESTFLELEDLYGRDSEEFINATNDKETAMANMVNGWTSGIQQMTDKIRESGGFNEVYAESLDAIAEADEKWQDTIDPLVDELDSEKDAAESVQTQLQSLADAYTDPDNGLISATDEMVAGVELLVDALDELINKFAETKGLAVTAVEDAKTLVEAIKGDEADADAENAEQISSGATDTATTTTTTTDTSTTTSNPYAGYRLGGQKYTIKSGDTLSAIAKKYYGKASLYTEIWAHNKSHLRGKNANRIYPGEILYLNTGGYTGDWGDNSGKLAVLHKKELVLNATDTQNILDAVNVMRRMSTSLTGLTGLGSVDSGTNALEQDVRIEATFPNVTSANEIETALNNLVNVAAQRVQEK